MKRDRRKKEWWLVEVGGARFWMQGEKEKLKDAGINVVGGPRE